ncbi:MAG: hypothetical protein RR515_03250 [Clostridium sp.]
MRSKAAKKIVFIGISLFEIMLAVFSVILYYSTFSIVPFNGMLSLKLLIPIAFLFLITTAIFNYISEFILIHDKKRLILILEVIISFVSVMLMQIFGYPYSLVRIIAIGNLAFYIIVACENIIYLKYSLKQTTYIDSK